MLSSQVYAGLYVIGQIGAYGASDTNSISGNLFDNDDNALRAATGRIGAGYLWNAERCLKLGLEAGFQGYQNQDIQVDPYFNYKYQRSSFDFMAVADFTPNSKIDIFAKVGPAFVMQKHNFYVPYYYAYSESENVTVPKAVVGIGYNVNEAINLNLSLNHEFKKTNSVDHYAPSATSVMAGLTFRYY